MAEVPIESASVDEVRAIGRRRGLDDLAVRLSLRCAERGRAWAARDDGEIVGLAIAHDSTDERFVGDCFVEPSYRGSGVGRALLQAVFADADETSRTALADPFDAGSLALALRFRLALREPVLRFAGAIPREEELAKMAAGDYRFEVAEIEPARHSEAIAELDRGSRGTSRPADHELFASIASGHAFFLRGECVAYAYVWPDGRIGPMASASPAYLVQVLAYALVTLHRRYSASWCTALVPGSNARIARTCLRAGLRVERTLLHASDGSIADLSTYVGYHRMLF